MSNINYSILIVDDEDVILNLLSQFLLKEGYTVYTSLNYEDANEIIGMKNIDIALIDMDMKEKKGYKLVELLSTQHGVACIGIASKESEKYSISIIKSGAVDILYKPFHFNSIKVLLEKVKMTYELKKEVKALSTFAEIEKAFKGIIGNSPVMNDVFKSVINVAPTNTTVLITGETGTGKELVTRLIHDLSSKRDGKLLAINCSSIPSELLESELFGYNKGAFTGAYANKPGLFELSSGGTLFLDEIGDLSINLQAKLLRVLEERKLRRLGGTEYVDVNFRLLAATNQDLFKLTKNGKFRSDLYYRLNVFHIHLPPLRERKVDIIPLAYYFLSKYSKENNKKINAFSEGATLKLMSYDYAGNIRELEHIITKSVIVCEGSEINTQDIYIHYPLEDKIEEKKDGISDKISIQQPLKTVMEYWKKEVIREYFENLILTYGWDIEKILDIAKIERSYFYKIVKKYKILDKYSINRNNNPLKKSS